MQRGDEMSPEAHTILRVTRTRVQAKASYDRMSRFYDVLAGGSERKLRSLALQQLHLRPGESVLEIGFGTGTSLVQMAEAVGGEGQVHGIDISSGMLRTSR